MAAHRNRNTPAERRPGDGQSALHSVEGHGLHGRLRRPRRSVGGLDPGRPRLRSWMGERHRSDGVGRRELVGPDHADLEPLGSAGGPKPPWREM